MKTFGRVEKGRRRARGRERRGNLSSYVPRLPDTCDDRSPRRSGEQFHRASEILVDAKLALLKSFALHSDYTPPALDDLVVFHRWTFSQIETSRVTSPP